MNEQSSKPAWILSLTHIWIVLQKEVLDNLRDRRPLVTGLISAMIGPIMIAILIIVLGKTVYREILEKPLELPLQGGEYAPALVTFLEQRGVKVTSAPADPYTAVRSGEIALALIIPPEYPQAFHQGQPATVRLVIDSSRQSAMGEIERLRELLGGYNEMITSLRLMARGLDPEIAEPLAIERVDMATPQSQVMLFLSMMPYFVVLVVFTGGMHVIIDSTAGERERSSLEPLLINPVRRWEFILGKLVAAIPFAIFSLFINLTAFALVFSIVPVEEYIGIRMTMDVFALAKIFLLALPMIFLASALQMIIGTFARSYKEAETFTSFLPLIAALPGIGLVFASVKPQLWSMLIPTFGQQILINQYLRGEPVEAMNVAISSGVTLLLAIPLILIAIRLYHRERILFGAH